MKRNTNWSSSFKIFYPFISSSLIIEVISRIKHPTQETYITLKNSNNFQEDEV